jgi:hypothetical protein
VALKATFYQLNYVLLPIDPFVLLREQKVPKEFECRAMGKGTGETEFTYWFSIVTVIFPADVSQWKHWYVFFDHDMEVLIRFAVLDNY